jgi:hypothetical protein
MDCSAIYYDDDDDDEEEEEEDRMTQSLLTHFRTHFCPTRKLGGRVWVPTTR